MSAPAEAGAAASAELLERLRVELPGVALREVAAADGMPTFETRREDLLALARHLRDAQAFEMCTLVTAVDLFPATPRFRVVHQLLSVAKDRRVRLHTPLEEDEAAVPSITPLWPGAGFFEREAYDMFGVRFDGHPDLRRLLMPDAYEHHPLRKDFPHQGIEPDRLYRQWDRQRRQSAQER